MTDPWADIDPPRGPWVWLALGIYVVSFVLPFGNHGDTIVFGAHAFGYSLAMLVLGPAICFTGNFGGWRLFFALAGLPWLANPCFWWCLIAGADDRRRLAAALGVAAIGFGLLGLPSGTFDLRFPAYSVWLTSLVVPLIGLALTAARCRRRHG